MFWDSLTQQTRVSQKDDVKVYEILLLPIYVGLAEEVVGDAEIVGDADAVVDGDWACHRLDVDFSHSLAR